MLVFLIELIGIVLLIILFVFLWRWLVRREDEIKAEWQTFLKNSYVIWLRRRFAPQIAFLQKRFSPESYLGLNLTVGVLVLVGASWLFGGIAEDVVNSDPLTTIDLTIANLLHDNSTPTLNAVMIFVSYFGSTLFVSFLASAAAVWFAWQKQWYRLAELIIILPGGMLVNVLLKYAFHRARPVFDNPILTLTTYSFPSGHAMAAMLLYGSLTVFAVWKFKVWRWRVFAVLAAAMLIILIDFSRIYLGVHYLSDVLAGSVAGLAWLTLCITAVETMRRRRLALQTQSDQKRPARKIPQNQQQKK